MLVRGLELRSYGNVTDPRPPHEMAKRSIAISGHRTSVSLEQAFWEELKRLAEIERCTVNDLVTRIDRTRQGNLSSAIRVHILTRLRHQAE
jgi:predicted DNA-binding ribbon-helix-helix protein